ncbi:ferredoxin:NADP oxidoreductase, beta subunit [Thermococcus kodakarensis KOD1]|uniref:Ferredoxin:NADP oxidoreductase, beta subunit n=1 Tax=Thermococcus kodakarensis (strain ATCC BAA-918 / JCM 12380 / KOD1) TaxID=69014 RepID=Q5JGS9_THEKO|nr:sulfide/dihydroorotate dehydrogenase-like FAD/NAD-binding protein [Thermococcus kodakarensis]WCN27307.1 sulfide/dihydroorotate dehydrogenase-like FAD/NAD-binding protein [Thermococcus kodakarensis]WCN29595.1 sulfide/dihydroorotate dehydrogenase-like FAD/NAD-binding protein [Thermococcus kodakarensis]BAD85515.1 ferredoxin:NADP oxidoreductase, beta subunit [Thermococcus kodakarensis KOD1]
MPYKILDKKELAMNEVWYKIHAPHVAKKVQPGQFVIVRAFPNGERIPLTPVTWDREEGWITLITFVRGKTTMRMANELKPGDEILNVAGPLGNPAPMEKFGRVLAIGLITGIVEVFPIARAWQEIGNEVTTLHVSPNPMVILREEFEQSVSRHIVEGFDLQPGWGMNEIAQELVKRATAKVRELLENEHFDMVLTVGPAGGQKAIFNVVKEYGIPMHADLHPIMVDATGMCGACRVTVGGEVKFACIDGPGFDAYKVDWDELIHRTGFYAPLERLALEHYLKQLQAQGGEQ